MFGPKHSGYSWPSSSPLLCVRRQTKRSHGNTVKVSRSRLQVMRPTNRDLTSTGRVYAVDGSRFNNHLTLEESPARRLVVDTRLTHGHAGWISIEKCETHIDYLADSVMALIKTKRKPFASVPESWMLVRRCHITISPWTRRTPKQVGLQALRNLHELNGRLDQCIREPNLVLRDLPYVAFLVWCWLGNRCTTLLR